MIRRVNGLRAGSPRGRHEPRLSDSEFTLCVPWRYQTTNGRVGAAVANQRSCKPGTVLVEGVINFALEIFCGWT